MVLNIRKKIDLTRFLIEYLIKFTERIALFDRAAVPLKQFLRSPRPRSYHTMCVKDCGKLNPFNVKILETFWMLKCNLVSISSTFYVQIFRMNIVLAAFL